MKSENRGLAIVKRGEPNLNWAEFYRAAVLETDDEKMPLRLREAKSAIDARLSQMQADHGGEPEERQALNTALAGLLALRNERGGDKLSGLETICRICQGTVTLENCIIDETGQIVHEDCCVRELLQKIANIQKPA